MSDLNERDTRLVAWLNEAYAKEAELESDLQAHIALTEKGSYRTRLQSHLKETREHKKLVARRIKALGGTASAGPNVPLVPQAVGEAAGKTVAAVKGQLGAARAAVTRQAETHLRNAQEEFREEHVEIALYTRIESFAGEVGDTETARLAKAILRDERRMAAFLEKQLPRLVKALVKADIPREQRPTRRTGRAGGSRSRTSRATSSRSSGGTSRSSATSRSSGTSRSSAGRSRSRSRGAGARAATSSS